MAKSDKNPIITWTSFLLSIGAFCISLVGFAAQTAQLYVVYTSFSEAEGPELTFNATYLNSGGTHVVVTEARYFLISMRGISEPACEGVRRFEQREVVDLDTPPVAVEVGKSVNMSAVLPLAGLATGPYALCAYHDVHDTKGGRSETFAVIVPLITWDGVEFDANDLNEVPLALMDTWYLFNL
jgi:hypothetical protein